jgi:hypothetical protein
LKPMWPMRNKLDTWLSVVAVVAAALALGCGSTEQGGRGSGNPSAGGAAGEDGGALPKVDGAAGEAGDSGAADGDTGGPSCDETDCHALATCDDSTGTAVCTCIAGYDGDGIQTCADVDECELGTAACAAGATCENTEGGFTCTCPAGYTGDGKTCTDANECAVGGSNDCHPNADCTNAPGSFTCACKTGFSGDGRTCADINECEGNHGCPSGTVCANSAGSFHCDCAGGFELKDGVCVDKCVIAKAERCDPVATCQVVANTAVCSCPSTHSDPVGDGAQCVANPTCETECTNPNSNCIVVSPTEVRCECKSGFSGDGTTCTDINECTAGTSGCSPNANCTNTVGGFNCTCKTGFAGNGVVCTNINECTAGTHTCDPNATCTDATPGYTCVCKAGYTGTGFACTNVNECTAGTDDCHVNANCTDTPGSFTCACKSGYTGDGRTTCNDINECTSGTHNCNVNATCTNTVGSFSCACNLGYTGNGTTVCSNVNECTAGTDDCDANATCTDLQPPARFSCACKLGYTGNGKSCAFQFCDLTGLWATRMQTTTSWEDYQVLGFVVLQAGTFTAHTWELRNLTYDGTTLTHSVKPCGSTYPDSRNPTLNEVYGLYIPDSTFDALGFRAAFTYPLANAAPNGPFTSPMRGTLFGIQLSAPDGLGAWPARSSITTICGQPGASFPCWSNDDADNYAGFTTWSRPPTQLSTIYNDNYTYPPAAPQVNITRRVACQHMGLRSVNRFNGTVIDCNKLGGPLEVGSIDSHLHSCRMPPQGSFGAEVDCTTNKVKGTNTDLVPCQTADEADLDARLDDIPLTVTNAKFVMVRVPAGTTCPTARTMTYPAIP